MSISWRLRPHGHGEANAARSRQLAVLDTLAIARVECGFWIDGRLSGEQQQVPADYGHVCIREAQEVRDRVRERVRQPNLAELEVRALEEPRLLGVKGVGEVELIPHLLGL